MGFLKGFLKGSLKAFLGSSSGSQAAGFRVLGVLRALGVL